MDMMEKVKIVYFYFYIMHGSSFSMAEYHKPIPIYL